jgi:hypothetical protein
MNEIDFEHFKEIFLKNGSITSLINGKGLEYKEEDIFKVRKKLSGRSAEEAKLMSVIMEYPHGES